MRYGLLILAFSVALAGASQGRTAGGGGPVPPVAPNGPIKCGWGAGSHIRKQLAKTTARLSRPARQVTYHSIDNTFAVHYDTTALGAGGMDHRPDLTDSDLSGTPDWVEAVAVALTDSRDLLLELGFDPAPDDGDGVYDVYLAGNLRILYGFSGETYGLTTPETSLGGDRWTSYLELDNDFSVNESFFTNGLDGARVTIAHEYFHAVQLGYVLRFALGYIEDGYLYELASTWFEDMAFPEINDWAPWFLAGAGAFGRSPMQPLAGTDGYSIAIFGHYLTEKFGPGLMPGLWSRFPSAGSALVAFSDELTDQGTSITAAWTDFVAGLFLNSTQSEYLFYPDQVLLGLPMIDPPQLLADSLLLTFAGLSQAAVKIASISPTGPVNLRLGITAAPQSFTARLVLDSEGLTPFTLTDAPWYRTNLNSLSEVIVVVGAPAGTLELTATAIDAAYTIEYALDDLAPNPVRPGTYGFTGLHLAYRLGAATLNARHRLVIYNLRGREVYHRSWVQDVGEGSHTLTEEIPAMANWASGVYLLTLSIGSDHTFKRTFTLIR